MSRPNPYEKFMGPEDHLQHQVITWLAWQYPKLKYHHSPDSGKRSKFEQFKYKYLGSDSGFPDLQFPSLQLVIELKVKPNKVTDPQQEWLDHFKDIGWTAEVCWSLDETTNLIKLVYAQKEHGETKKLEPLQQIHKHGGSVKKNNWR